MCSGAIHGYVARFLDVSARTAGNSGLFLAASHTRITLCRGSRGAYFSQPIQLGMHMPGEASASMY